MKGIVVSLISGVIFSFGLVYSGMTNPEKVIGFLDIFGKWDPALTFVMGGAVLFNLFFFYFILKKKTPLFEKSFDLPLKKEIDKNLILGAVLFGIGWGIVGICPGPAVVNLVTLNANSLLFVVSMLIGMFSFKLLKSLGDKK